MMTHLPPSFACPKCPMKFVQAGILKNHLKIHAGILNEVCKFCNEGYTTKVGLAMHIQLQHFSKLHCEVLNCSYKTGAKRHYISHLQRSHKKFDKNLIAKFIEKVVKLKPDFNKMQYV